ncbi:MULTISPECIES: flagellar basal body-associated FliL family protein [unclassified Yoonia]|uniref:flagellar basal body-associated FliL family protein n=1 Tax=unclassified Yoonia TaxID=2629118 RepID=UPI002AFFF7F1|nr:MULTISPECIES: flagellar basal body-associated FliL family protein [unclassified Yoonia]
MTAAADPDSDRPRKAGKKPLLIGVALAVLGGGGGFFAVQSGLLAGNGDMAQSSNQPVATSMALTVGFVALDPLVISLPATNGRDHLRFSAQLEVPLAHVAEVEAIKPRIVDVLNGYLRAVDLAELENPAALGRMRSQMLRRVQVVAGDGRISDLLIMEFVLS